MRLILARHGETELNKQGRIQGLNDDPLTDTGRAQAEALARALVHDSPFFLYSSPIRRAVETAGVISRAFGTPATTDQDLAEAAAGALEGLTGGEMRAQYPEFAERWSRDSSTATMPGGESLQEVQDRAWNAVTRMLLRHSEDTVVAVTHNFTIRGIICKALGMPMRHSRRLQHDLGAISRLVLTENDGVLLSLNETWHLTDVAQGV